MALIRNFILSLLLIVSCARPGAPTGGPDDETPPLVSKSLPENMSINIQPKKIVLRFNEFVTIRDFKNNLIVSPKQEEFPKLFPSTGASKKFSLTFQEALQPNTTYSLSFGNSIVDYNNNNPYENFKFVFSTGNYIDSLNLAGEVRYGYKNEIAKGTTIMLHQIDSLFNDSIIYKETPDYISTTLDSNIFEFQNLKKGKYLLTAINEKIRDYLFNPKTDYIAFHQDTISLPTDDFFELILFKEEPDFRFLNPFEKNKGHIVFKYEGDSSNIRINPLFEVPDSSRTLILPTPDKDSIDYWYSNMVLDSMMFELIRDTIIDTFQIKPRKKRIDTLAIINNKRGSIKTDEGIILETSTPIDSLFKDRITVEKDTIPIDFEISLNPSKRSIEINFDKEDSSGYNLILKEGAVVDFFEKRNDSINYRISTLNSEVLSSLNLEIKGLNQYPVIVELIDINGKVVDSKYSTKPEFYIFKYLKPNKYFIRLIFDINENKKWDTGKYLLKIFPEKVITIDTEFELREGWELNETIQFRSFEKEKDSI